MRDFLQMSLSKHHTKCVVNTLVHEDKSGNNESKLNLCCHQTKTPLNKQAEKPTQCLGSFTDPKATMRLIPLCTAQVKLLRGSITCQKCALVKLNGASGVSLTQECTPLSLRLRNTMLAKCVTLPAETLKTQNVTFKKTPTG